MNKKGGKIMPNQTTIDGILGITGILTTIYGILEITGILDNHSSNPKIP
jgi:hypothetical protein